MEIKFNKAFAGKKKGESMDVDPSLASQLVRVDKVATFVEPKQNAKLDKAKKEQIAQKAKEEAMQIKEAEIYEQVKAQVIAEMEAEKEAEYLAEIHQRIIDKLTPKTK